MMKYIIFVFLFGLSLARPGEIFETLEFETEPQHEIVFEKYVPKIIRSERTQNADGSYSFHFETEDGIVRSETGTPLPHAKNAIAQIGSYSFPLPNGEIFELKFQADENGFQPQSSFLPQAPDFPHPYPRFVLDQIEKARIEDEEAARREAEQRINEAFVR